MDRICQRNERRMGQPSFEVLVVFQAVQPARKLYPSTGQRVFQLEVELSFQSPDRRLYAPHLCWNFGRIAGRSS